MEHEYTQLLECVDEFRGVATSKSFASLQKPFKNDLKPTTQEGKNVSVIILRRQSVNILSLYYGGIAGPVAQSV